MKFDIQFYSVWTSLIIAVTSWGCAAEPVGSGPRMQRQVMGDPATGVPTADGTQPVSTVGDPVTAGSGGGGTAGVGVEPVDVGGGVPSGGGGVSPTGGFNAGSDPARNNVAPGQVCARLAAIQCAGEAFCCSNPGRNQADCETTMRSGCVNELYLDEISLNPVSGFDAAHAAVAFEQFEQRASSCDMGIAGFGASLMGFAGMFRGTRSAGDSCRPGTVSDRAASAASLASCLNGATTACRPRSVLTWECDARTGAGGTCFADTNCQDGLFCNNPSEGFNGTCQVRQSAGAGCDSGNQCDSFSCRGGVCQAPSVDAAYCLL